MTRIARWPALAIGIPIGVVIAAARLAGGGTIIDALVVLAIAVGYAVLVTVIGSRNDTVSALAGRPVDERWEHIGLEASALAFGASAIAVLAIFALTQAGGGAWQPYALVAAVMGVSYAGSLVIVRLRH
jgi:hypothetical protein